MKSATSVPLPSINVADRLKHAATTGYGGWILNINSQKTRGSAAFVTTRFNPGNLLGSGFVTLYLAFDESTALLKKRIQFGDPFGLPGNLLIDVAKQRRTMVVDVDVDLRNVVDLTILDAHRRLATNAQELTGDWIGYQRRGPGRMLEAPTGVAPTQKLGWELFHEAGVEGVKTISATNATACCIVVFPHKLTRPGSLAWDDPNTGQREQHP